MFKKIILAATAAIMSASAAFAGGHVNCGDKPLSSLSAGFEAWKVVTGAMSDACSNYTAELDQEFRTKQPAALAASPSVYTMGGVANSTMVPLLTDGLIRPLNDLVAAHGGDLAETQLIKVDGQVMAIAMMVNAQHLFFRADVLEELDIAVPTTWDEVLAAAAKIQDSGKVDYALGGTFKAGWNLAEEFVNMYMGFGGAFFDGDNATVNNEAGVKTLETLKAMTAYMDPEYLVSDSTYVQQQFQQGKIAMANLWASRASAMDNAEESQVVGLVDFAAAPAAMNGGAPATTLWWDGITIATNVSDEEADSAFQLMMHGLSTDSLADNASAAIWLNPEIDPGKIATGAIASANGGAPAYPASKAMGIMHTALGNNIADFLTGAKSAADTLASVEADYTTAATEAGIL